MMSQNINSTDSRLLPFFALEQQPWLTSASGPVPMYGAADQNPSWLQQGRQVPAPQPNRTQLVQIVGLYCKYIAVC